MPKLESKAAANSSSRFCLMIPLLLPCRLLTLYTMGLLLITVYILWLILIVSAILSLFISFLNKTSNYGKLNDHINTPGNNNINGNNNWLYLNSLKCFAFYYIYTFLVIVVILILLIELL